MEFIMNLRINVLIVLVTLYFGCQGTKAEELYLSLCDDPAQWWLDLGWEVPGATGKITTLSDAERGQCLRIDYDFHKGGQYIGPVLGGSFDRIETIRFWIRLREDGSTCFIRIMDATGQCHVFHNLPITPGQWSQVEIPIEQEAVSAHWAGENDGIIHFPLQRIEFCVNKGTEPNGYFLLDDVSAGVESPADLLKWYLEILPGVPNGVAFVGEKADYEITLENRLIRQRKVNLELEVQTDEGEINKQNWELNMEGGSRITRKVILPTEEAGYQGLLVRVLVDGKSEVEEDSGLAVVVKPSTYRTGDPKSYFGICAADGGLESIDRLGCNAVLLHATWRLIEPTKGDYDWSWIVPGVNDAYSRGMPVLFKLMPGPPPWMDQNFLQQLAPEQLEEWRIFVKAVVSQCKGKIYALEVDNEPDLGWWLGRGIPLEESAQLYHRLVKATYEAVKAADPNCLVATLGVTTNDYYNNWPFCKAVLSKDPSLHEMFAGHPYAFDRYIGPGWHARSPEENDLYGLCQQAMTMLAEFDRPQKIWIGELGYALHIDLPVLSDYSLQFASLMTQAIVTSKAAGVEKCLWFTQVGANENGYEYGLFRGRPLYALPAACAYSTCARMIDRTSQAKKIDLGGNLTAWRFDGNRQNQSVVVLWSRYDPVKLAIKAPPSATAVNSFGREIASGPQLTLDLPTLPIYVAVPIAEAEDLAKQVADATMMMKEPVKIQNAYLTTTEKLTVALLNQTNKSMDVTLRVIGQEKPITLAPGLFRFDLSVKLDDIKELALEVESGDEVQRRSLSVDMMEVPKLAQIQVDGSLERVSDLKGIQLAEHKYILPVDPGIPWDGKEDLSVTAWLGWNEQVLYYAAQVTDDQHFVDRDDVLGFWQSDCIQLAIDPENDSLNSFDEDDVEIGFVLGKDKPYVYMTVPIRKEIVCDVAMKRIGMETIYEVAIPWSELGIQPPQPGKVMAINFIVNENEGMGRIYWMGLSPGIAESKQPGVYRKFVFQGDHP